MARYKRNAYKDDPTISAELVKFMAVNTGFEALDILTVKVKAMESDLALAKKDAAGAIKSAMASANKSDELKKFCDLLFKRIVKLEK